MSSLILKSLQGQNNFLQSQCKTYLATLKTDALDAVYLQQQLVDDTLECGNAKTSSIKFKVPTRIPMYEMNTLYSQSMAVKWLEQEMRSMGLFCKSIEGGSAVYISWHPSYTEKLERMVQQQQEAERRQELEKEMEQRRKEEQYERYLRQQQEEEEAMHRQRRKEKPRLVFELNGKMSAVEARTQLVNALLRHDNEKNKNAIFSTKQR